MISEKQHIEISKFLSLVLRHQPEKIGIVLDENGWTDVPTLIAKLNLNQFRVNQSTLKYIVDTNSKKRFAFNETFDKIRASQGHSVKVELKYIAQKPPEFLYHGTSEKSVRSILQNGLERRSRLQVHLSKDVDTAIKVGQRHGKPFVFKVLSEQMYNDEYKFLLSANGVWLTEQVPAKYLKTND